ncbi:DUF523 and DUF1722 domain-containing protein [Teredinibacter sp. KSP-S5-2]|uniref:YbgA family protein n=1 Tax=Teredinibacter sp. KSP-S5-2 TaxID=3034506 RepID=UPI0029351F5F|nr:DUF523 and DUF1722 domain-containing protein [Teredinibacter sp. KSP-S5-2]WNO11510.1 DUF523 and DUF1722 domain-containing protein [Teredinibacter sp. KSP-S5-2]
MSDKKQTNTPIAIGISSCLLGEKVRFDTGHKNNDYITKTLSQYFQFRGFCPEVSIGLGIPREPIRLVTDTIDGEVRCIGTKTPELDVTDKLTQCGKDQLDWVKTLSGYIFKKDSPSCGMERVKVYYKNNPKRNGVGLFASVITQHCPNLPTEEEGRLGDAMLRENFIKRVFLYHRWQQLIGSNPSKKQLVRFHAQHKLIYMSHNQSKTRKLGQLVAKIGEFEQNDYCEQYLQQVTDILSKPATRKNNTNVLKHIQGYLKRQLDTDDKQELEETIEQYRTGLVPLIVPITILKHHFRKFPDQYIDDSLYMQPHPQELMLRNQL